MNFSARILSALFAFLMLASTSQAFVPATGRPGTIVSSVMPRPNRSSSSPSSSKTALHMGGKQSKFGVFSPAVYGAKLVLGSEKLNKFRGKAISLHSQYIGDFCLWVGAYHLRTALIKMAKTNGDTLGFLV
jgi:hypothetical protein